MADWAAQVCACGAILTGLGVPLSSRPPAELQPRKSCRRRASRAHGVFAGSRGRHRPLVLRWWLTIVTAGD